MFRINSVLFCGLGLFVLASAKVVSYIDPCKWNDDDCILKSSRKAQPHMESLIENSVHIKNINGDTGDLKLNIKDMSVKNLSKCKIIEAKRPKKLQLSIKLECPVDATGKYEIGGKLFLLDIFGKGDIRVKTDLIRFEILANLVTEKGKDGKEFYKPAKYDYKYIPVEKITFDLKNLYNGDKEKAEPVYKIFDENWKEVFTGFGGPVIKAVVEKMVHVIAGFIHTIPLEEFELPA